MKIANADKLIKHFENVIDVKLFTPAQIITLINRFSAEIPENTELVFTKEDDEILIHNLDEKRKLETLFGGAT